VIIPVVMTPAVLAMMDKYIAIWDLIFRHPSFQTVSPVHQTMLKDILYMITIITCHGNRGFLYVVGKTVDIEWEQEVSHA